VDWKRLEVALLVDCCYFLCARVFPFPPLPISGGGVEGNKKNKKFQNSEGCCLMGDPQTSGEVGDVVGGLWSEHAGQNG